jgi:uncharacterized protein (TIGR02594 family)
MSKFRVIATSLNVRRKPNTASEIVGKLSKDAVVEPLDLSLDEKWFFVQMNVAGKQLEGWIFKDFLVPEEPTPVAAASETPKWLEIAMREIGVQEVPGPGDNPRVLEYHQTTTLKATDDAVAWCSSFVNWCMKQAGIQGSGSAAARSWLTWGKKLDGPRNGCIAVLKRGNNPNNGHVAFYVGETNSTISLLGGNQGDQVKVSAFPKTMVLSYRWPN